MAVPGLPLGRRISYLERIIVGARPCGGPYQVASGPRCSLGRHLALLDERQRIVEGLAEAGEKLVDLALADDQRRGQPPTVAPCGGDESGVPPRLGGKRAHVPPLPGRVRGLLVLRPPDARALAP